MGIFEKRGHILGNLEYENAQDCAHVSKKPGKFTPLANLRVLQVGSKSPCGI